jgi:hypothetical protein
VLLTCQASAQFREAEYAFGGVGCDQLLVSELWHVLIRLLGVGKWWVRVDVT